MSVLYVAFHPLQSPSWTYNFTINPRNIGPILNIQPHTRLITMGGLNLEVFKVNYFAHSPFPKRHRLFQIRNRNFFRHSLACMSCFPSASCTTSARISMIASRYRISGRDPKSAISFRATGTKSRPSMNVLLRDRGFDRPSFRKSSVNGLCYRETGITEATLEKKKAAGPI